MGSGGTFSKKRAEVAGGIKALKMSGDNTIMAALTNEGKVLLWRARAPEERTFLKTDDRVITALGFIPEETVWLQAITQG